METRIRRRGVKNEVTGRIRRGVWISGSIRGGGGGVLKKRGVVRPGFKMMTKKG